MTPVLIKYRSEFILLSVIVVIYLISYLIGDSFGFFGDRQRLENFIQSFGYLGPVAIMAFTTFEVIIAPIPGGISPAVSGFLYGPVLGSLFVFIGSVIGANVTFWIARIWGEKFFLLFINKSEIEKFQDMVRRRQTFMWAAYFLPVMPYDVLNIAIGLSDISWRKFAPLNALGMSISVPLLTLFGSSIFKLLF